MYPPPRELLAVFHDSLRCEVYGAFGRAYYILIRSKVRMFPVRLVSVAVPVVAGVYSGV